MIVVKTKEEIELMRESALIVSKTLGILAREIKPGVSTLQLDKIAEEKKHHLIQRMNNSSISLYGLLENLLTWS